MQMTVEVPPAFHIFYATGWEEPVLRVRELSPDSTPINEVPCCLLSEVGMQNSAQDNWDLSLLAASPAYVQDTSPAPHCTGMIWAPAGGH